MPDMEQPHLPTKLPVAEVSLLAPLSGVARDLTRAAQGQTGANASEGGLFSLSGRISVYAPTVLAARLLPSFSCA